MSKISRLSLADITAFLRREFPQIYSVAKFRKANRFQGQGLTRVWTGWHTDITAAVNPPAASMLRGETVPPYGGDTQFTSSTGPNTISATRTSSTLFVGEKHVPLGKEGQGWWDNSLYNGDYHTASCRAAGRSYPLTTNPQDTGWKFGSRHTGVVNFCFADGGVRRLPESIDPQILELLGMRDDGQVIPDY